jgi:hypothetical protein
MSHLRFRQHVHFHFVVFNGTSSHRLGFLILNAFQRRLKVMVVCFIFFTFGRQRVNGERGGTWNLAATWRLGSRRRRVLFFLICLFLVLLY